MITDAQHGAVNISTKLKQSRLGRKCRNREVKMGYGVKGVITDIDKREVEIKKEWTAKATAKNNRIVAKGYAQRQIENTLKLVKKIDTNL